MDRYLETTLKLGVLATLGKGDRQGSIVDLIKKYKAPYLVTIGGASAVLAQRLFHQRLFSLMTYSPKQSWNSKLKSSQ